MLAGGEGLSCGGGHRSGYALWKGSQNWLCRILLFWLVKLYIYYAISINELLSETSELTSSYFSFFQRIVQTSCLPLQRQGDLIIWPLRGFQVRDLPSSFTFKWRLFFFFLHILVAKSYFVSFGVLCWCGVQIWKAGCVAWLMWKGGPPISVPPPWVFVGTLKKSCTFTRQTYHRAIELKVVKVELNST